MTPHRSDQIAAFCHIPKTGGMTFLHLLRRYFGLRHLEVLPGSGWVYLKQDLVRDLRWNPWLRSIGGHPVRPFVDFAELDERIKWYTVLRNPIERCISNYQHQVEKLGIDAAFSDWMRRPENCNWHVRMLGGGQDLEAAKQVLAQKIRCFGLIERYNEFLLLLRESFAWTGFRVAYPQRRNPPKTNEVRRRIKANFDEYRDVIHETNELDLELYRYAVGELYPPQVAAYGPERLQSDLETEFAHGDHTVPERLRKFTSTVYCKLVYQPLVKAGASKRASID